MLVHHRDGDGYDHNISQQGIPFSTNQAVPVMAMNIMVIYQWDEIHSINGHGVFLVLITGKGP